MGGADFINVLFSEYMVYDPDDATWTGRDRFFLDPGHMSPMLYSALALQGKFTIDELKQFRQWDSPTPGHPERDICRGIENTSGPLGQGHTFAAGAAVAEKFLEARLGKTVMQHKIYAYISDGGIEEEISQGAGRLAGLLGLNNLIMFYDANDVQLSTKVSDVDTEDVAAKYRAWGWNVIEIDGSDPIAIAEALEGDHREPAAGAQDRQPPLERPVEFAELVVDRHPQRLEDPSRRMPRTRPPDRAGDYVGKLGRGLYPPLRLAPPDDRPRDAPRPRLLAELAEDRGEGLLALGVHEVRGSQRGRPIHAHVKGSLAQKAEPAPGVIQLRRRYAQVQQDPVDFIPSVFIRNLLDVAVPSANGDESLDPADLLERLGVAVDAQHAATARNDLARVASAAKRPVHVAAARLHCERVDGLLQEDRHMQG